MIEEARQRRLEQYIKEYKDHWQQIQDLIEEISVFWKGEGAADYKRLYENGVRIPLNQWIEVIEDEKNKLIQGAGDKGNC